MYKLRNRLSIKNESLSIHTFKFVNKTYLLFGIAIFVLFLNSVYNRKPLPSLSISFEEREALTSEFELWDEIHHMDEVQLEKAKRHEKNSTKAKKVATHQLGQVAPPKPTKQEQLDNASAVIPAPAPPSIHHMDEVQMEKAKRHEKNSTKGKKVATLQPAPPAPPAPPNPTQPQQLDNASAVIPAPAPPACLTANIENTLSLLNRINSTGTVLPIPFLNMGFPKSGSTTLQKFFECAGIRSRHQECGFGLYEGGICGPCMRKAVEKGEPPIYRCSNASGFTQMDYNMPAGNQCFYPQIELIQEFHDEAPQATFILLFRGNMDSWVDSVLKWNSMKNRMVACNITGLPRGKGKTREELKQWFCGQVKRVRNFVKEHPSHALIEVDIEKPNAGPIMDGLFRNYIVEQKKKKKKNNSNSTKCWGHFNINTKVIPQKP